MTQNEKQVLQYFSANSGSHSVSNVASGTGLDKPSVEQAINSLVWSAQLKLVAETKHDDYYKAI